MFEVTECKKIYEWAVSNGAISIMKPTYSKDSNGAVLMATIHTYGDVQHTFVQKCEYSGPYLPGYTLLNNKIPLNLDKDHDVPFCEIDHCVGNQDWVQMDSVCNFYHKALGFHKYITDDDYNVVTEYSALETTVMASENDRIKMPITMPAVGKRMSQVEEYIRYNNGPGVQHIALRTDSIIKTVTEMRRRGVEFINVSPEYYVDLKQRLAAYKGTPMKESLEELERLSILVDFNNDGYLLQLFVKDHISARPTAFYEIIQREGARGFGGGNFRALFESIEREQEKRGNLREQSPDKVDDILLN